MVRTKVTRNYQITIPRDIRESMSVEVGDTIILTQEEDGAKMKKFYEDAFKRAFGSWKTKETGLECVRKIRNSEKKRLKRLGL